MKSGYVQIASAAAFGVIFGFGLILGGMTNPARVIAFLDIAGDWDPSLALVMATGIAFAAAAFAFARRKRVTLLAQPINLPDRARIDRRLVLGSALFGIGWGLAGICPGPAIVLLGSFSVPALVFVVSVVAGMTPTWRFESPRTTAPRRRV